MLSSDDVDNMDKYIRVRDLVSQLMDEKVILIPSFEDGVFGGYNINQFTDKDVAVRDVSETIQDILTGQYGDAFGVLELIKGLAQSDCEEEDSETINYDKLIIALKTANMLSSIYEDKSMYKFTKLMDKVVTDAKSSAFFYDLFKTVSIRNRKTSTVKTITYFIENPSSGLVKIGRTTNLEERLKALEYASGCKLKLLATVDKDIENSLHKQFNHLRIRGEWFRQGEDLLKYIRNIS